MVALFFALQGRPGESVAAAAAAALVVSLMWHPTLSWRSLIALLIVVILFVPIRRFILPGSLPFQLEPYRILVALLAAGWLTSLLIDRRVKPRLTGFDLPIFLFLAAMIGSIIVNNRRISVQHLDSEVFKSVTFFLSYVLVMYLIVSVIRNIRDVVFLLKVAVSGTGVVAFFAVVEARTGYNVFDHVDRVLPFLERNKGATETVRYGLLRATGPAEHPIALGVMLAMMVPIAGVLAYTQRRKVWAVLAVVILTGCLVTVSRTGVLVLAVEALVFFGLRRTTLKSLLPGLVPLLVVVHLAAPGTLDAVWHAFSPKGGLAAEQQGFLDSGRLGKARLDPTFAQIDRHPLLGIGWGTRIVSGPKRNSPILDDQWLGVVLQTGIIGGLAWVWLFVRLFRRLGRVAREDDSERGWLVLGMLAAAIGLGASMLTYDVFSFVQVTFVFFMLLGISGALVLLQPRTEVSAVAEQRLPATPFRCGSFGFGLVVLAAGLVLFDFFQSTSIKFFLLVLGVLALAMWAIERGRQPAPSWAETSR